MTADTPDLKDAGDLAFEIVSEGLRFPEGPVVSADGAVFVVEIGGKTLTRVHADGAHSVVAELGGGPNGAAIGPDGWIYVCNSGGWRHGEYAPGLWRTIGQDPQPGWIEKVHPATGAVERLYERVDGAPLQAPNDLVFDTTGGFWFSDHGKRLDGTLGMPGVYYARADGAHARCVLPGLLTPNGVGLSPDGRTLYVAETATRCLWAFDVPAPGEVAATEWPPAANGGRLIAGLPGYNRLDSLAVSDDGWVFVGTLVNGGIWEIAPDGREARFHRLPDTFVTNIAFGGSDRRDAYITLSASGRLARARFERAGLALAFETLATASTP